MSFETIRIYRDYPIIDNKVRVNDIELSEIEALAAYDGSEIIELFGGLSKEKQEIFRLAPIIPGNPGPSEWFVSASDIIGVKQIISSSSGIVISYPTPTAYYKMDETSGNRIDSVGGLNLILNSGTAGSVTGVKGNALYAGFITASKLSTANNNAFKLEGDYYIACWIRGSELLAGSYIGNHVTITDETLNVLTIYGIIDANLYVQYQHAAESAYSVLSLIPNVFNFVEIAWDYANKKLFTALNGSALILNDVNTFTSNYTWGASKLTIGHDNLLVSGGTDSYIDELILVKGSIPSTAERAALYNFGVGVTYPFT